MTRVHWWAGVCAIVAAVFAHALVPRYEWRQGERTTLLRVDRWTGQVELGYVLPSWGRWVSVSELRAAQQPHDE